MTLDYRAPGSTTRPATNGGGLASHPEPRSSPGAEPLHRSKPARPSIIKGALAACLLGFGLGSESWAMLQHSEPAIGDAGKVLRHYERWTRQQPDSAVRMPLSWSKARSVETCKLRGVATLEVTQSRLSIELRGESREASLDLWIFATQRGSSWESNQDSLNPGFLDDCSIAFRLGAVDSRAWESRQVFALPESIKSLELDSLALTRQGQDPQEGGLLFAAPTLFQRMRALEQHSELEGEDPLQGASAAFGLPLSGPSGSASPATGATAFRHLRKLVAEGEQLFLNETFDGNGRTCATCHPPQNNFTLDPAFIAGLAPTDPLFVAETVPELDSSLNGGLVFEDPVMMRDYGLIVENVDGFGDLANRFTLRSVQHLSGLALTMQTIETSAEGLVTHLTGWSGDGAPGSGSLREFAEGAVRQHLPKTTGRVAGVDFRLPTSRELLALESFQLSIGRSEEVDVQSLDFVEIEEAFGRDLFLNQGACNACHRNAGATSGFGGNRNFNSGVEAFTQNHPYPTGGPRPPDGGFGRGPNGDLERLLANPDGSFGDRMFNPQSVIEAADTMPAFHSNLTANPASGLTDTIEGAIEFYNSVEFTNSGQFDGVGGLVLNLSPQQVGWLGRFLRVLNALDNMRAVEEFTHRALVLLGRPQPDLPLVTRVVELALADCDDAIGVLAEVNIHQGCRDALRAARAALVEAKTGTPLERQQSLVLVPPLLDQGRATIIQP